MSSDTDLFESVVDRVVEMLDTFTDTENADGGIFDIVTVDNIFWTDPGVIGPQYYPCFTVEPVRARPAGQTTGYDERDLQVRVTFLVDMREYWEGEPGPDDPGSRILVQVGDRLEAWFRRKTHRNLLDLPGVRSVDVTEVAYNPQVRGVVVAKSAQLLLTVHKNRRR